MHNYLKSIEDEALLVYKKLKSFNINRSNFVFELLEERFPMEEVLFYPQLTLMSVATSKKTDNKIKTLAFATQLMYISTELHSAIPAHELNKKDFYNEIQLPILIGDLLYSKLFNVLYSEGCLESINIFISYIDQLNLAIINYLENKISIEELCIKKYGLMGRISLMLGIEENGISDEQMDLLNRYGQSLGTLFGAQKMNLSYNFINNQYRITQDIIQQINLYPLKQVLLYKANTIYKNVSDTIYEPFNVKAVGEN